MRAMAGGSIGAHLGRRMFRHKTRKRPFVIVLKAVLLVQVLLILTAICVVWTCENR